MTEKCKKCGFEEALWRYCPGYTGAYALGGNPNCPSKLTEEHHDMTCVRCGFGWTREVLNPE